MEKWDSPQYKREIVALLGERMTEPHRFIQVITEPCQAEKTTAAQQCLAEWPGAYHYASADLPAPPQSDWILQQWQHAHFKSNYHRQRRWLDTY